MVKAVYIHIPFCKNICSYCAFCKMYTNKERIDKYLKVLDEEIKENYQNEKIKTIYVGGGTPSDLNNKQLKYLLEIIEKIKKQEDYEFTFECNISVEKEKLILLKEYGVNRLSFGIETISNRLLKRMNRNHTKKEVKEKIDLCRKLGFNNINGDLMYAFEEETDKELEEDIEFLLSLNLEHISTYSLIIEEHTKLFLEGYQNCKEEKEEEMYQKIHRNLIENEYIHYEISNFAKKGYNSIHNLTYWNNEEYYGFGMSASGYIGEIRYKNTQSFTKYLKKEFKHEVEKLDIYDKMSYEMILGLRLKEGVNIEKFTEKYKKKIEDVFEINELLKAGYLKKKKANIYIPFDRWYVQNYILEKFVR